MSDRRSAGAGPTIRRSVSFGPEILIEVETKEACETHSDKSSDVGSPKAVLPRRRRAIHPFNFLSAPSSCGRGGAGCLAMPPSTPLSLSRASWTSPATREEAEDGHQDELGAETGSVGVQAASMCGKSDDGMETSTSTQAELDASDSGDEEDLSPLPGCRFRQRAETRKTRRSVTHNVGTTPASECEFRLEASMLWRKRGNKV